MRFAPIAIMLASTSIATAEVARPYAHDPSWKSNAVWDDGRAEYAVYDATRPIYGVERTYEAVLITNAQHMDSETTTKAENYRSDRAFPVFKHNLREVAPTENYDYKYLTTVFVERDSLEPFKLSMSSQEDCGATFKNFVVLERELIGDAFVYFPGDGHASIGYTTPPDFQFYDALTLTLRDFPFEEGPGATQSFRLLPEQTSTRATSMRPAEATVRYITREPVETALGPIDSHCLRVEWAGGSTSEYWFAADGGPEWLHILVQYQGFDGHRLTLKSKRRWAYWER
ncbi:MAG: hypothetical protein ACF8PN_00920 [Phycisphaerales bacterium]